MTCHYALPRGMIIASGTSPSSIAFPLLRMVKQLLINKVPRPLQHHSRQTRGRLPIFAMPPTIDVDEASAAPPDGGYGWVCVVSLFLVNFSTWGAVAGCETLYARRIMIALLTSDVSPSVYTSHTTCVPNAIPTHQNWSLLSLVVSTLRLR